VAIIDKANVDSKNGKWQMHSATHQLHNSVQDTYPLPDKEDDEAFAQLFPGMLRRIASAMKQKESEIRNAGVAVQNKARRGAGEGYDVDAEIRQMQKNFPKSWASRAKDEPDQEPEQQAAPQQAAPQQAAGYAQYLHPEFRNNVPDIPEGQQMRLKAVKLGQNGNRKNISGMASGMDDLLNKIRRQKPDWLEPGTLVTVEPAD
jgi:hypothetical protein